MSPQLETEFDRAASLGFGANCSSFSSSFFSSSRDSQGLRRPSFTSSNRSNSPGMVFTPSARSTSPITPVSCHPETYTSFEQYTKPAACLATSMFHPHVEQDPQSCIWLDQTESYDGPSLSAGLMDMLMAEADHSLFDSEIHGFSRPNTNLALAEPSFDVFPGPATMTGADTDFLGWNSALIQPATNTVEPSATVRQPPPSSPGSTPPQTQIPPCAISSNGPSSSVSLTMVPSQNDIDESPYDSLGRELRLGETKRLRSNLDRLSRRRYDRRRPSTVSSKPEAEAATAKSGLDCDLVITQNEFACSYPGCIDKHTGKEKRFKRLEHKKRHEKTVHEKAHQAAYKCWVPECNRPFSRADNLKSHLKNTHSRRPGARGNRYVATLDKNSEYYDPEWVGGLDKDGYPIH